MTRPKVLPENRIRTAQACDSCKRRKQKCNGECPCNTCEKRSLSCSYGEAADSSLEDQHSAKRRVVDTQLPHFTAVTTESPGYQNAPQFPTNPQPNSTAPAPWGYDGPITSTPSNGSISFKGPGNVAPIPGIQTPSMGNGAASPSVTLGLQPGSAQKASMPRSTSQGPNDEEAMVEPQSRLLQDTTGRLLYIGDSATLSFLQLMRFLVEGTAGQSPFTTDPNRHRIVESRMSIQPGSLRPSNLLPDKQTSLVLVNSFFTNTFGIMQVFDQKEFISNLEACYSDPLNADPLYLCLLNLTLAIGLALATPTPGTPESLMIQKLQAEKPDRTEIFFMNAKNLVDPSTGFEDADFWSIQALLLMAVYMLTIAKRNAASAYFGMAVRSAFALGLHKEETMVIFPPHEQEVRRNLWRSLYVFDRFISASLGRPTAISDDDCSGDTIRPPASPMYSRTQEIQASTDFGLEASVRSCHVIGTILKRVYQKRKISTKLAQEIADECRIWTKSLAPGLHRRNASPSNPLQGIAILHVNLFYCHCILLLTRPFFIYLIQSEFKKDRNDPRRPLHRPASRLERFAEACVTGSSHSIVIVQNAFEGRYLPRRNPFVTYFLFAAALVVLSNEFFKLFAVPTADQSIEQAVTIMKYCSEADPQAARLHFILTAFRDAVATQQERVRSRLVPLSTDPMLKIFTRPPGEGPFTPPSITATDSLLPGTPQPLPSLHQQPSMERSTSLSDMLDLGGILYNPLTGGSDDSSAADEQVDFDAFWQWPPQAPSGVQTPSLGGTPRADHGLPQPTVGDVTVPLFGMARMT